MTDEELEDIRGRWSRRRDDRRFCETWAREAPGMVERLLDEVDRLKTILDDYDIPYEGKEKEPPGDPISPQDQLRMVQRYLRKAYLDLPEKPNLT